MVHRCCVVGCARESYPGCGVTFHTFPNNAELRQKWIEAIPGRTSYKKSYTICSLHFERDDFRTPTVAPFMLCKRKLKLSAIPSIFPTKKQNLPSQIVSYDSDLDCEVAYPFPYEGMPHSLYSKVFYETNEPQARRPKYSWEKTDTVVINDDDTEVESEAPHPKKPTCGECGGDSSGPAWWCVSRGTQACAECAARDAAGYWLRSPEGRPQGEVPALLAALKRELNLVTVKQEPKEEPEEPVAVECEPTPDPLDLKANVEEPDDEESRPEQVVPVIRSGRLSPTVKVPRVIKDRSNPIPRFIIQKPVRPIANTTVPPQPRPNTAIQPRPMVVGGGPGVTIQVPTLNTAQSPRPSRPLSSLPNPYVKLTRLQLPASLLSALKRKAPPVITVKPAPVPRQLIRVKIKNARR